MHRVHQMSTIGEYNWPPWGATSGVHLGFIFRDSFEKNKNMECLEFPDIVVKGIVNR